MAKNNVRRRKRRQEHERAVGNKGGSQDNVDIKSSTLPMKTRDWLKRNIVAAVVLFTAILLLFVLFRDTSAVQSTDSNTGSQEDAARPAEQQQQEEDSRDTSMDGPDYQVLQVLPHDTTAFTQGLSYLNGYLYESTGYHGESQLRRIDPSNGQVLQSIDIDKQYFGEGLAHFVNTTTGEDCLIQLTWEEKTGFIYRASDFELLHQFSYETSTNQGWGITHDPQQNEFIVSDGSSFLHFWNADTLQETRRIQVTWAQYHEDGTKLIPIARLNELEYYQGNILANVWYVDAIVSIDPVTGNVERVYRFDNLYRERIEKADCFNGIALSDTEGELFVTGKWWPHLYRIKLLK